MMLAFLPFAGQVNAGIVERMFAGKQTQKAATIRVLVADDKESVVLEVKGRYKVFNPEFAKHIATRMTGKRKTVQAMKEGLRWGEEFPGLHQLCIVPDAPDTTIAIDGVEYRGTIYVYDVEGLVSVVNQVSLEDYASSILAPQYNQALPDEMLAAVAITARTTALYQSKNPKTSFWDVEAGEAGYKGLSVVKSSPQVEKALAATRNMVMSKAEGPFMAGWEANYAEAGLKQSSLSLHQAESLANNGENAAQILTKAFPGATIQLVK